MIYYYIIIQNTIKVVGNLYNLIILLLSVSLLCCSKQNLDFDQLKVEGYIEVKCNSLDTYQEEDTRYIEFNKHFDSSYKFLIARCFDKENCSFRIIEHKKITCQRYSYNRFTEDKRDYLNDDNKEFVDHKVLYIKL